jgi:hypothetical protein
MIIASPTLTLASVLGTALVASSTSREIVASVNLDKDPADASLRGFDGDTLANEGQECSFNELLKVQETSDADLGIFGCDKDKYCAEDPSSSLGGHCINLKHDFHKTLAAKSQRRLQGDPFPQWPGVQGLPCYYSDGSKGYKCQGEDACYSECYSDWRINPDDVGCGSCNGRCACYRDPYRKVIVGEKSCVGFTSCFYGEYRKGC